MRFLATYQTTPGGDPGITAGLADQAGASQGDEPLDRAIQFCAGLGFVVRWFSKTRAQIVI